MFRDLRHCAQHVVFFLCPFFSLTYIPLSFLRESNSLLLFPSVFMYTNVYEFFNVLCKELVRM